MTVAKVLDFLSKLPSCCGQASDAVTANLQVEMKDAPEIILMFRNRIVQRFLIILPSEFHAQRF